MATNFNQKLLDAIDKCLPNKSRQVELLSSVISLGKEAAYRRLRGEVLFSFEEACKISNKLGLSFDDILDISNQKDKAIWTHDIVTPDEIDNYCNYYFEQIISTHEPFVPLLKDPTLYTMGAFDTPPHSTILSFPTLFRFRCLEWIYHMQKGLNSIKLADIHLTPDQEKRREKLSLDFSVRNEQIFIFDRRFYTSFADLIYYFCELNFISPEERMQLKNELIACVLVLETFAIEGKIDERLTWTFISNIDLNGSYAYVKGAGVEFSSVQLYQLDVARSSDSRICRMQRLWIESLRKYSTLISIGGDKERNTFFQEQKKYIEEKLSF